VSKLSDYLPNQDRVGVQVYHWSLRQISIVADRVLQEN